ncbi:MAG: GntP family permease [Cellvibrionaceae bacterium]
MFAAIGLVLSVFLLIWLALRGVNIILASLICSLVVVITNQLPLAQSLTESYTFGPLGAFTFAGKFFLLFVCGAMFGRLMGDSGAAASIASALAKRLGAHRALWITVIAAALLTYGGVVVFVVIFAIYPLGLKLLQEANIPKRLFCAAMALGSGTFTLTALPGTPSIHNVIASARLGTDLFAGSWLGLLGGGLMFVAGMWYLERERNRATAAGEVFEAGPNDVIPTDDDDGGLPPWALSIVPLIVVISTILLPRLLKSSFAGSDSSLAQLVAFANSQPIFWPSVALVVGCCVTLALFASYRAQLSQSAGTGAQEAIMPLINTAAVIGFGGVVTQTAGFQEFTALLLNLDFPPLVSMFMAVSLVSAIVGSASGGLQIFMESMAPSYLEMGVDVEVLHRVATMASGGLDSLPHCGAVVAMLTITGLTHKQAYKDVGVITVVIPVMATIVTMGVAGLVY